MGLIERLFRARKSERIPEGMTHAVLEKIVQDYGAILGSGAPAPGCVADVRELPYPKEHIKLALAFALSVTDDPQMRSHLKSGYISLADWQEGVGERPVGIDLTKQDVNADPLELAREIAASADEMTKWRAVVSAEAEALKAELQELGFWED